jgi:molybdate transport system permease protein
MDFAALWLTLRLAALTTVVLMVVATPLAAWIAGGSGWGRRVAQAAVALPLVLPPTVLGFYLLVGLGPATAVGRTVIALLGHPLAFTFSGLVVASAVYGLPFAVQPLVVGFSSVDRGLVETARVLGAGPWTAFRRVVLPLSKMSFATAAVLTFAHTVGEFGVVLMVGGDIPGVTRTMSIAIFDRVQEGNYSAANEMAGWLVVVSFLVLLAVYRRQGLGIRD